MQVYIRGGERNIEETKVEIKVRAFARLFFSFFFFVCFVIKYYELCVFVSRLLRVLRCIDKLDGEIKELN